MDDAKALHSCRLLYEALCDDLELRRLVVHVEPQHVSITIYTKRGRQESKVIRWRRSPRPRKIPRPRMSVCSTSGGSVTSQRAGASICARSPTAFTLKSSAQCVHFQSFYLLCQVPRGSVEEVSSKAPPTLQARIPPFACSAPNGRFYSSANHIATPRRIGPTMKAMGAVKTNRADLLTATDIDRSRSIASLVKEFYDGGNQRASATDRRRGTKRSPLEGAGAGQPAAITNSAQTIHRPCSTGDRALRSFSPASSAWHPGKSEIVFCRNTSGGRALFYSVI